MFYIFLFLFLRIYYYKIIIFNVFVKRKEQLVDVSAIEVLNYLLLCWGMRRLGSCWTESLRASLFLYRMTMCASLLSCGASLPSSTDRDFLIRHFRNEKGELTFAKTSGTVTDDNANKLTNSWKARLQ